MNAMKPARLFAGVVIAICIAASSTKAQTTYTESVLYSFCPVYTDTCPQGSGPFQGIVQGSDGNFYGTTTFGGTGAFDTGSLCSDNGCGTVYQLTPAGQLKVLHVFCNQSYCPDGALPGNLTLGSDGNLYGAASGGYVYNGCSGSYCGILFKVTRSGTYTVLYAFCSQLHCPDGDVPFGAPVQGSDGDFYGMTSAGGANGQGTIFKITSAGALSTLYNFCSLGGTSCTDGEEPGGGLLQGSDGNFYGVTYSGGANGEGTVFKITSTGTFTTVYSFCNVGGSSCTDGRNPGGILFEGADGNLYGVSSGGPGDLGQLFKITTAGSLTRVCSGCVGGLILASDGNFYGIDAQTEADAGGIVFKVTPAGTVTTIYSFCSLTNCVDGYEPYGLIQGTGGNFYGATFSGGANGGPDGCDGSANCGTVFELAVAPALPAAVQLSLNSNSIALGASVEVTYKVLNAFSLSAQQCYGFSTLNGVTTAVGKVTGTLTDGVYGGSANVTFSAAGVYHLALTCGGVESGFATLTVNGLPTTSTLTASPNPATVGQAVTLTTSVTGSKATPTGTVTFYYGSDALDTVALNSSGVASFTASSTGLPAGTYAIHAVYSGSATYAASTSPAVNVKLEAAP